MIYNTGGIITESNIISSFFAKSACKSSVIYSVDQCVHQMSRVLELLIISENASISSAFEENVGEILLLMVFKNSRPLPINCWHFFKEPF